ncbi:hypothetical protein C1N53_11430 [Pontibacter sp. SGAir0037]|nr:hypothetical protein C1N53_11430 [Pontibacter sp. SGAir0037]
MSTYELAQLQDKLIVFYDGTCGFCQASVQFILKYNNKQNILFATLQSGLAEALVPQQQLPQPLPDSMLFYESGRLFMESEAALRIAKYLNFPLSWGYYFRIIPLFIRNAAYRFIARNRYRIAGRREACLLPSPKERMRFLNVQLY